MSNNVLLRRQQIADMLGMTVHYFDYLCQQGRAPKPITADGLAPQWKASDIGEYKDSLEYLGVIPLRKEGEVFDLKDSEVLNSFFATRAECAKYAGVSTQTWDKMVKKGVVPEPRRLPGFKFRPKWNVGEVREKLL